MLIDVVVTEEQTGVVTIEVPGEKIPDDISTLVQEKYEQGEVLWTKNELKTINIANTF